MHSPKLPVECLELIVEHLHHDSATLYNLLTTNRLFFHIAVKVLYKSPFRLVATIPASCAPYEELVYKCAWLETAPSQIENSKDANPTTDSPLARDDAVQPRVPSNAVRGPADMFAYSVASSALPSTSKAGETTVWGEQILPLPPPLEFPSNPAIDTAWLTPTIGTTGVTLAPSPTVDTWLLTAEEIHAVEHAAPKADEPLPREARMQHLALRQQLQQDRSSWSRFLRRTELLGRLLLLSVDIPGIQERAPRLHERFVPNKPQPRTTTATAAAAESSSSLPSEGVQEPASGNVLMSLLDGSVRPAASILDAPTTNVPDLISFIDLEDSEESEPEENNDVPAEQTPYHPTIDYFQHYTHIDHRGLWSVLTLLFPGAGRRVYDRIQAEIELGILKYCAPRIESIQITNPQLIIPFLLDHGAQCTRLREIELLDKSWKASELKLVHDFLLVHARYGPAPATVLAPTLIPDHQVQNNLSPTILPPSATITTDTDHGILPTTGRTQVPHALPGIRRFKYRSSRSPWDNAKLNGRPFDPLQLLVALGSGVNDIDTLCWPVTQLAQIMQGKVDAGAIQRLRLRYLDTPFEPSPWHAPEFLRQCRRLEQLRVFTFDGSMFSWAVVEQQARREHNHRQRQAQHGQEGTVYSSSNAIMATATTTPAPAPSSLVPLKHLELTAPGDEILGEAIVSALYAFQKTLESVNSRSQLERREGLAFDPLHVDDGLTRPSTQNLADLRAKQSSTRHENSKTGSDDPSLPEEPEKQKVDKDTWEDDDGFRDWMTSAPITVRWPMEQLRELRLTGGRLALEFDLDSLQWMPKLHTLVLGVQSTNIHNDRFRWTCRQGPFSASPTGLPTSSDPAFSSQRPPRLQSLIYLPYVAGPQLRRIMIQGPWPEISDCTLAQMINVGVETPPGFTLSSSSSSSLSSSSQGPRLSKSRWGDSLLELTVLDNCEVTVQGMTHLAACMERVQIVGFNTKICSRTSTQSWPRYQELKRAMRQAYRRVGDGRPLSERPHLQEKEDKDEDSERIIDWMWDWWTQDYQDLALDQGHDDSGDDDEDEDEDALLEVWPDARPSSPVPTASSETLTQDDDFRRRQEEWVRQQRRRSQAFTIDPDHVVEDWLLRAQVALPWVDLGPDARHLGHRTNISFHSEQGWMS